MSSADDEDRLPAHCPFEPGATLKLQLHGTPSESASCSQVEVEAEVVRAFLPFSNGQALHVRLDHPRLPPTLLVKLFDRRFCNRAWISENSWSPASELAARAACARNVGAAVDDPELDLDRFFPEDAWLREKVPWLRMLAAFRREREAYRRLAALQGTAIPNFYATLSWRDPQLDASPAEHPMFALATPGLAVEFVEGPTLAELKSESDWPTDAEERMSASVLDAARAFGRHGVIHDDIRSANIVLRSPTGEPVIIDFGRVVLRGEHETEAEWTARLRRKRQINEFRRVLSYAGVHDPTPPLWPPEGDRNLGYLFLNAAAETIKSPAKRLEWFEPVACDEPGYRMVANEDGVEVEWELQRWRMRPGVRVRPEDEY